MIYGNIKNIIFDWGGVITNIDYGATINAFEKYGIENFEEYYSKTHQSELFILHETGQISPDEFRASLIKETRVPISDEELDSAWMAMLKETPFENIELLESLKNKYRLFLLSNTNAIHVKRYSEVLKEKLGLDNGLSDLFEEVYYSHEVGMKKPDVKIFKYLMEENKLKPSETLFIDNSIQNIDAAKSLGLKTIQLIDGCLLSSLFPPK
ncbi:HAD family phosphatase [Labilibacter sediminis]|nr:HAD family phosphatase [Labilibacter sediminis]